MRELWRERGERGEEVEEGGSVGQRRDDSDEHGKDREEGGG